MNREFESHLLNEQGLEKAKRIGAAFDALLESLTHNRTAGWREMSIVRAKLEEACFFAVKSMSMQPENQRVRDKPKP